MILIDPPVWPAHGTVFSHLVSDTSLNELHRFAEFAEISRRAFDGDHYDVPQARYSQLIDSGAQPVSGHELIRRLRTSGLRVPARKRPSHASDILTKRWYRYWPGHDDLSRLLLQRWSEPHRTYHNPVHLLDTLLALEHLYSPDPIPEPVRLAAWFHDAVHDGVAGRDEHESAALARAELLTRSFPSAIADEVARLVELTTSHAPDPGDSNGCHLSDADLSILGGSAADYSRYVRSVRAEYQVSDEQWRNGRSEVLTELVNMRPLFRTSRGIEQWQQQAERNMTAELAQLRRLPNA